MRCSGLDELFLDTTERAPALHLDPLRPRPISAPASTSWGSPGLWLRVRTSRATDREPGAHRLRWAAGGEDRGEDDLVLRAIRAGEARRGSRAPAMDIELASEIPVGRGFGSSGAAVAAGLLLEAAVSGDHDALEQRERVLLADALRLEGHPDNATASLLGGCTLGVPHEAGLTVVRQPVHPGLGFAVAWPERPLFTEEARAALPDQVPFADAVENPEAAGAPARGAPHRRSRAPRPRDRGSAPRALPPGADPRERPGLRRGDRGGSGDGVPERRGLRASWPSDRSTGCPPSRRPWLSTSRAARAARSPTWRPPPSRGTHRPEAGQDREGRSPRRAHLAPRRGPNPRGTWDH